jgi:transposase-like protein
MGGKRHTPEQILEKLQSAERALAKGMTAAEICRKLSITEQTFYRWRRVYGGSQVEQAERIQALERENARLRKLVAEQALHNSVLQKGAPGDS